MLPTGYGPDGYHRQAPALRGGRTTTRQFKPCGATPESLVDTYMKKKSPVPFGKPSHHRQAPQRPAPSMSPKTPEDWWKLHVLGTQVREASTLQQSFRKEAWVNSLLSPRYQSGYKHSHSDRPPYSSAYHQHHLRPRHRPPPNTAAQAFAIAESMIPEVDPYWGKSTFDAKKPKQPAEKRSIGIQASPRAELIIEGRVSPHRKAPAIAGPPTNEEVRRAQENLRVQLQTRFRNLQDAFMEIDADRDGQITLKELLTTLEVMNLHSTRREVIEKLFSTIDHDDTHGIDFNEFCKALTIDAWGSGAAWAR